MASVTEIDFPQERWRLVDQTERQGIRDAAMLEAMRMVSREAFLPPDLHEFFYQNATLPIGNEQTISQPYIVAMMATALELKADDRVLETSAGSGYTAAVLSRIAQEVYTVERHRDLAESAQARWRDEGFDNVHVHRGDGTFGWPEHAPYDAIVVVPGDVPQPLLQQLRVGGRLVIPIGHDRSLQRLVRVNKTGEDDNEQEDLGDVRSVPLVGAAGWEEEEPAWNGDPIHTTTSRETIAQQIGQAAEPSGEVESCQFEALPDRIGQARLVLIDEATHGTSEFYRMRARIIRELFERRGFDFVAIEADRPDAARINGYVQHRDESRPATWQAFTRFPTWMWRNGEVLQFWLDVSRAVQPLLAQDAQRHPSPHPFALID